MKTADVLDRIRALDPVDGAELSSWTPSFGLHELMARADSASRRWPRRRVAIAAGAGSLVLGIGTAVAAGGLLGGSAPDEVKQQLADLDRGMPADLRYDPDLDHARAVAVGASAVLYMADTRDGGYCLEVVADAVRSRGATCVSAIAAGHWPLEISAPIPSATGPVVVAGRANDSRIAAVSVEYSDGSTDVVPLGLDRTWLLEVPEVHRESAVDVGLTIVGSDRNGVDLARSAVPPLGDDDPSGSVGERNQPIFVSTISDGDDLTLVLGVEGRVNVPATALALEYPDGATASIDLAADGTYHYDVPPELERSFADHAGTLVASDASGATLATTPVGSVAYWRRVNG